VPEVASLQRLWQEQAFRDIKSILRPDRSISNGRRMSGACVLQLGVVLRKELEEGLRKATAGGPTLQDLKALW
jgi:hypothetical protein